MNKGAYVLMAIVLIAAGIFEVHQKHPGTNAASSGINAINARDTERAIAPAAREDGIDLYFSPDGGCEAAIVDAIHSAARAIDMQAYSFTSHPIMTALEDAQHRGITVRAIFDKTETTDHYSGAAELHNHGIATYTDGDHPIAHNKVIIIDGRTIITGSFNFTRQAEKENAENLLIITGKSKLADAYEKNFENHLAHSAPYAGAEPHR